MDDEGGAQVGKQSMMSSHSEQVQRDLVGLGCYPIIDVCHAWSSRPWTSPDWIWIPLSVPAHAYPWARVFPVSTFPSAKFGTRLFATASWSVWEVSGSFPSEVSLSELFTYLTLTLSGDIKQSTKHRAFPLNKCIVCSGFRLKMNIDYALWWVAYTL